MQLIELRIYIFFYTGLIGLLSLTIWLAYT